ncbi:MAG: hypothetical protein E4H01_01970 [Lysobacterales bacterium]|nr:MAG: hypothetical protein E4H01_01970 [Xanthomonadales bacterium]
MINRRQFLAGLFVAPAIVKASNLMPIMPPDKRIIVEMLPFPFRGALLSHIEPLAYPTWYAAYMKFMQMPRGLGKVRTAFDVHQLRKNREMEGVLNKIVKHTMDDSYKALRQAQNDLAIFGQSAVRIRYG